MRAGAVILWLVVLAAGCAPPRGRQLCDAIARRDLAAVQQVLAGPQLDPTISHGRCVPADVFSEARPGERVLTDIAIELLKAGMPPDASWIPPGRSETVTAIEAAARNGNETLVRALLAVGLDTTSVESTRALVYAAGAGHLVVVRPLVEEGADLDATAGGETALDRARANERADVVQFLETRIAARDAAAAAEAAAAAARDREPSR
jgi:hypothetical protein